jgi:hypothetical protein
MLRQKRQIEEEEQLRSPLPADVAEVTGHENAGEAAVMAKELAALTAELRSSAKRYNWFRLSILMMYMAVAVTCLSLWWFLFWTTGFVKVPAPAPLYIVLGILGISLFPLIMGNLLIPARLRTPPDYLDHCHDIHLIPVLWHGRKLRDPACRDRLYAALARLLGNVTEADLGILTASELQEMCEFIHWADSPLNRKTSSPEANETTVAMVHALGCLGGEGALAELHRLQSSNSQSEIGQKLRDAAIEALPGMRERIRRERAGEGLLRASGKPGNTSGELLRSVSGQSTKHDAQELGRAVDGIVPPGDESKHTSAGRDMPC